MKFRIAEVEVPKDEPFKFDALERKQPVEFLRDLIKQIEGPFVLALDSPWGTGKTTVVQMLRRSLELDGLQCVYFNAWKDDYVTDPLIPMVSAIDELKLADESIASGFRSSMASVKKAVGAIAKRGVVAAVKAGTLNVLDLDEVIEDVAAEMASESANDLIEAFQKERDSLVVFRKALEVAVGRLSKGDLVRQLIFFIDELDRCRPSYAIELLERVKHLFDVANMVFVLSIDKRQLEAITAAVYGERIDAQDYLRRFFDLEVGIPTVTPAKYVAELLVRYQLNEKFSQRKNGGDQEKEEFCDTFNSLAKHFGLSLRMIDRCLTCLAVVMSQTPDGRTLDSTLVAVLIILRMKDQSLFKRLVGGDSGPDEVMNWLGAFGADATDYSAQEARLWIDAYLRVGDSNRARRDAQMKHLREQAEFKAVEGQQPSEEQRLLVEVYERCSSIRSGRMGSFSLVQVAAKVDLAASMEIRR